MELEMDGCGVDGAGADCGDVRLHQLGGTLTHTLGGGRRENSEAGVAAGEVAGGDGAGGG